MPAWLKFILEIIGLTIVVFVGYAFLKQYVFSKLKVNKWVVIGLALVTIVLPIILQVSGVKWNSVFSIIQSIILVILFLWFFDLMGWGPKTQPSNNSNNKKSKYTAPTVIKAKAKPNRLKTTDMEVIDIKNVKKNKKK
jgi:energy-coupling factor transporter transmembrane protein EcfT